MEYSVTDIIQTLSRDEATITDGKGKNTDESEDSQSGNETYNGDNENEHIEKDSN